MDDFQEGVRAQGGPADERAVDVGLRQQRRRVVGLDAAAVEDARRGAPASLRGCASSARMKAWTSCAPARAWRPCRCRWPTPARRRRRRSRRVPRPARRRARARPGARRPRAWAGLALLERLADADDRARPVLHAAAALRATTSSVSPKSCRRSLCPRITQVAPASRSIAAEISPVKAPASSWLMFWAASRCRAPSGSAPPRAAP